jgi:hypothetical protein
MKVEIQKELAVRKPLAEIVEAATPILEEAIGPPAVRVTASWGFRDDERGRPVIRLTLVDRFGQKSGDFEPSELQAADRARRRFYRLWGDLLQEASERLSRELQVVAAEGTES